MKYGGNAMGEDGVAEHFAQDIVLMRQTGIDPVVVHGGGPQIGAMLKRLEIKSSFVDGLRVTDQAAIDVVEMVLTGTINKQIVSAINNAGGRAVGVSGKDGQLIIAKKLLTHEERTRTPARPRPIDLGFVGEPDKVNTEVLQTIVRADMIAVIAPIGVGRGGRDLQHQRRHRRGRRRGRPARRPHAAADGCARRHGPQRQLDRAADHNRGARPDRRRHDLRRNDPQG